MWSQNSDVIGSSRLCSQFATVTYPVVSFTQSLRVTMNSGVWAPKILGAQAFPQVLSLNCPLDQNRVDEHQVVLQQLATVLQSQVGRLKKSREILKLWSAPSRCKSKKYYANSQLLSRYPCTRQQPCHFAVERETHTKAR